MSGRIREFDWTTTPLGAPQAWPPALQTLVGVMLGAKQAMCIMWGPDQIFLYNDGYADILVNKHPAALGQPIREVWPEIWGDLKPIVDATYAGQSTHIDDMAFTMLRKGYPEEAHFSFSFTPVYGADEEVVGSLMPVVETTERVFRERRARLEGQHFARLFEQAPTFMTVLSGPSHIFEYCNPGYMQLIGHRDLIGKPVAVAVPEAAGQGYFELLDEVYRSGKAFSAAGMKLKLQRTPGAPLQDRYLDFVYQPIVEDDGSVSGIFVEGVDVTDRVLADADLRESEARLRLATDAADIGLWDYDFEAGRSFWQPRVKVMFGLSADAEVAREDLLERVHSDDRGSVIAALEATRDPQTRAPYDIEYRTIGKSDGLTRWVSAKGRAVFNDSGDCIRILGTAMDVTARKQNEQRLEALNADLERQVIERTQARGMTWQVSPDLLGALNPNGYFETSNPAWKSVLGWSEAEVAGFSIFELLHPDDVERTKVGFELTKIGQPAIRFPNRYRHKDGSYRWISWTGVFEDGYTYCSGRDITEEYDQQEQLRQTEDALRQAQKMEAVGQLTGGIAHDFNNMLAVVLGSLELLNRRIGGDDPRTRRQLDSATEAAKRAANLTQRLLAFSRQQPLRPETLDVNRLVANMSDLLRHSIGADIRLETVLAGGLWKVHIDPNQLENVILNLGVNARDAMAEGGRLTIETQNAHLDKRYVASELGLPAGQYVLIAVTDTGIGMSADTIAKAFDPFFTTKAVGKGTGLGLSQVYGFVRQSGGHVKIYSEPGHGTTIKIYLPRTGDVVSEVATPFEAELSPQSHDEVILIVDDEPAVRQFTMEALIELGYRVHAAENAASALKLLDAHPEIALLFTDIVMPDTNGRRLADQACERRPGLKVLYTTGYTRNAVVHNGVVDPGVELIGKPFTLDELAARVREILDGVSAAPFKST